MEIKLNRIILEKFAGCFLPEISNLKIIDFI